LIFFDPNATFFAFLSTYNLHHVKEMKYIVEKKELNA